MCLCETENSAQLETVESLQELAVKIPYDVDSSWSDEAEKLREIAVKSPDKLSQAFILKFFKSLRIVDKKAGGLFLFKNLVISALFQSWLFLKYVYIISR